MSSAFRQRPIISASSSIKNNSRETDQNVLCIDFDALSRSYSYKFVGLRGFVCYSRLQFLDADCDLFAILDLFAIFNLLARLPHRFYQSLLAIFYLFTILDRFAFLDLAVRTEIPFPLEILDLFAIIDLFAIHYLFAIVDFRTNLFARILHRF